MGTMRVFVYYNLHRNMFSVKALEGEQKGRVIAHRDSVFLEGAVFKVSEAGRQRVIREKRKNVHAGVVGIWTPGAGNPLPNTVREITYNPYKYDSFVYADNLEPIVGASRVWLKNRRVYV